MTDINEAIKLKSTQNLDGQVDPLVSTDDEIIKTDTERLLWLINNSAVVCHASDGENCWVQYQEDENTVETLDKFDDPRNAIDAAIDGKVFEY